MYSKLPVFDPSSPEEAYAMVARRVSGSPRHGTPVILRPTTRVCHGYAAFAVAEEKRRTPEGFVRIRAGSSSPAPLFSTIRRSKRAQRRAQLHLSRYPKNAVTGAGRKGVAAGGVSYAYHGRARPYAGESAQGGHAFPLSRRALRSLFWRGWTKCSCWRSSIP